jgi:serine/threonine protein kinase
VYKVYNSATGNKEVISIMNTKDNYAIDIETEYEVSKLLTSLVESNACPNFLQVSDIFTCNSSLLESHWGSSNCPQPNNPSFKQSKYIISGHQPDCSDPGLYYYMQTELCDGGDVEDYIKKSPKKIIYPDLSCILLFQMAFALHAAADKFSMKDYDIKLLNILLKQIDTPCNEVALQYAVGCHTFALKMYTHDAFLAKVADYGTVNTQADSNGQSVTSD